MAGPEKGCQGLHFFDHLTLTTNSGGQFDGVGFRCPVFDQYGHQIGPVSHSGVAPGFAEERDTLCIAFCKPADSGPLKCDQ
jgi:hypothetical protein